MKRLLLLMALPIIVQGQKATVTGNLQTYSGAALPSYVEFSLSNCGNNQPKVAGVAVMLSQPVDFYADANGVIDAAANNSVTPALYGNDVIVCGSASNTVYGMQFYINGQPAGPMKYYNVLSTTGFNINTAMPVNANLPPPAINPPQNAQYENLNVIDVLSAGTLNIAGTLTAGQFIGNLTGNLTGNVTGNVVGGSVFGDPLLAYGVFAPGRVNITQIGWNQAGSGETDFFNQSGTGPGGFNFYNANGSNVTSAGSPVVHIDQYGTVNAMFAGNLAGNVTGNLTGNVTGNATTATTASAVPASGITGSIANSQLAHSSTSVNGQTCTLGSTCTIPLPTVVVQSVRVTSAICTTSGASNGYCSGVMTEYWPTPFADANYAVSCTAQSPSVGTVLNLYETSKTAASVSINLQNGTNDAAVPTTTNEIDCIGVHP